MERLTRSLVVGVALAVGGALVMLLDLERGRSLMAAAASGGGCGSGSGSGSAQGVALLLLGTFASALYYIVQKPTLQRHSALSVTAWEYLVGFGAMALTALLTAPPSSSSTPTTLGRGHWQLSATAVVALWFSVLFNSVGKYALSAFCNKHVSVIVLTVRHSAGAA